jgi:hypothetical protein
VQAGKFLGFLLTRRGIEANPDKCQRDYQHEKPLQHQGSPATDGKTGRHMSFLILCWRQSFLLFCFHEEKRKKFEWTPECEDAFQQVKFFLSSPPVLQRPSPHSILFLYLAISENAMSTILVEDSEGGEKPIYFVIRVFKGAELRYQKIERLALAVVITARKLRPYFQSHKIVVKTDYPIRQVLGKPDLVGRMVAWSKELSEYDVQFVPRDASSPRS